jgi:hypothetical protein
VEVFLPWRDFDFLGKDVFGNDVEDLGRLGFLPVRIKTSVKNVSGF